MLPPIHVSLPLIFLLWCVASYLVFDSFVMWAYPAMWCVVGILFVVLHFVVTSRENRDSE